MKRIICLLALLLSTTAAFAQFTNTPNIGLKVPIRGSNNWDIPLYYDWTMIDNMLGGQVALPNGLKVTGPVSMPGFTFTSSQIVAGLGYQPLNPANNLSDVNNAATALANLGGIGANSYQGTWSSSPSYSAGALVNYSGVTYISLQAGNVNNIPSSSPSYWGAFGSGSGIPGGTNGEIQYNNSGVFGGYPVSNFMLSAPTGNQTITYSVNGPNSLTIANPNAGSGASSNLFLSNGTNILALGMSGTGSGTPSTAVIGNTTPYGLLALQAGPGSSTLGAVSISGSSVTLGGAFNFGTDSGTANAYVVTVPQLATSEIVDGAIVSFSTAHPSTGASTLSVAGVSGNLVKNGSTALTTGDILASPAIYDVKYDGANWQLLNSSLGGGGSLPSANLGQMLTNNNGTTGYAGQANVYYQQSGDTITSIEAECATACTYVVTSPQTITLSASHAMNSNVWVRFEADGQWTVNGATFTLSGIQVNGGSTLSQHFVAGTGSVALGAYNSQVPVEWFGAVGGATLPSTDSTTAIQACFDDIYAGQCFGQSLIYKTTATLNITRSNVGFHGIQAGRGGQLTTLETTSASADVLDVHGSDSSHIIDFNKLDHFYIARSVAPTGTAAGLSLNNVGGAIEAQIASNDSICNYYYHDTYGYGTGVYRNLTAGWVLGETSGTYNGFCLDSNDGNGNYSVHFFQDAVSGLASTTPIVNGANIYGTSINDETWDDFETAEVSYGAVVNFTTGGSASWASDLHFVNDIHDGFYRSAYLIENMPANQGASLEITNNDMNTANNGGSYPAVDIETSAGIKVSGNQIGMTSGSSIATGVYAFNSTGLVIGAGNTFYHFPTAAIELNNTNGTSISGDGFNGYTGAGIMVWLTGTSANNNVCSNSYYGSATVGVRFDSSTATNAFCDWTAIPSSVTTAFTNTGTSNAAAEFNTLTTNGYATVGGTLNVAPNTSGAAADLDLIGNGAGFSNWTLFSNGSTGGKAGWFGFYDSTNLVEAFAAKITSGKAYIVAPSTGVWGWNSQPTFPDGTLPDTGLSRDSAGVVDVGNGTPQNASGTLKVGTVTASVAVTAPSFTDSGLGVSLPVCTDGSSTLTTTSCNIATLAGTQTFSAPITFTGGVNFTARSIGINAVGFYINGTTLVAISGGAELQMAPTATATSSNNYAGTVFDKQAAYWTGTVAQRGGFYSIATPAVGSNPLITLNNTFVAVDTTTSGGTATGQETWNYPVNFTSTVNGLTIPSASGNANFTQTIASGVAYLPTTAIASSACGGVVTVAATGVLATDNIAADFNSSPIAIIGYEPGAMLTIIKYPTAGNVNFQQCNNTAASITPAAVTLDWRVTR